MKSSQHSALSPQAFEAKGDRLIVGMARKIRNPIELIDLVSNVFDIVCDRIESCEVPGGYTGDYENLVVVVTQATSLSSRIGN